MDTKTIQIQVTSEAAQAYESASQEERRKLDALLSLKLSEVKRGRRSLEAIMSEISRKAQERGMTPEILESILNERE
ncbi:MAG: hypothetical protein O3B45_08965 [Bacteroidetes bacterium]|nr:hypothetical protein [Bacteroidota bacterium]